MAVVVAIELGFPQPLAIGRGVLHAAKQRRGSSEIGRGVGRASKCRQPLPDFEPGVQLRQGGAQVAVGAQIAPSQPQARVPSPPALVGHQELAGKQAGAAQVGDAQRHLRQVSAFFEQPELDVYAFVFVGLLARQRLWAVQAVEHIGVAKAQLQRVKRLDKHIAAFVGLNAAEMKAHLAGGRHAGGGRLQQASQPPVVGADLGIAGRRPRC